MKTLCVIPARLNSQRLPRKMLALIDGQPMIQHTYLRAKKCDDIDEIVIATDDEEIANVCREVGAKVLMTPEAIQTGSDRVALVAREFSDMDVVINLQGDEPFIRHQMLSQLLMAFKGSEKPLMATLAFELGFPDEYQNPNFVKVLLDQKGYAIYFSRAPIPFFRTEASNAPVLHHMGLYAYDRDFLLRFTQMQQTPLEKIESLEQLRALENGYKIRVIKTEYRTLEVNNAEELALARDFIKSESAS